MLSFAYCNEADTVLVNQSGKYLLLARDGKSVVEGEDNPDGVSVICCPGGTVEADVLRRIPGLAERLAAPVADEPAPAKPEAKMVKPSSIEDKMMKPAQAENKAAKVKASDHEAS